MNHFLKEANKYKGNLKICYDKGIDCAKNGANEDNCHFGLFASPEMTKEWERGNKDALKQLLNKE